MVENHAPSSAKMWMVRAGRRARYIDLFLDRQVVDIGWGEVGPILPTTSDDEIRRLCAAFYPDDNNGWHQIRRFNLDIAVGDSVVTYDNPQRVYHVGVIDSSAEHGDMAHSNGSPGYVRKVNWACPISRDDLSAAARNSLGGMLTVFQVPDSVCRELWSLGSGEQEPAPAPVATSQETPPEVISDSADILQEYIDKSDEFIEDQIAKLNWTQMQELVAGILRAMGYRTKVSSPGPDRGVDVFASLDGLGLTEPRIFVEVKHRQGSIGAQDIRAFMGGRHDGDRCLYVSTGGFSREARYEADRSRIPLTLLDLPDLRELLVNHYETLDPETRAMTPLRKVYWPAALV